jgi:AraC-like DNA-binding protein
MSKVEQTNQIIDPSWSVYAAPIITILQVTEQLGLKRASMLSEIGLSVKDLAIPERRFPVMVYYRLYDALAIASDDPDIALKVGRINYLKGLNFQLYMSRVCKSFRDYLNLMPSTLKLRGDLGEIRAHRDGDLVELRWEPLLLSTAEKRFLSDEMLSAAVRIINSICIMPVEVAKASFSYSKPINTEKLESLFGNNLSFNQSYSSIYFHRDALDLPMLKQDYQEGPDHTHPFRDFFEEQDPSDELLFSLKRSIAQYLPEGEVTVDKLAGKLNVSRRTLQRRLSNRDTNFLNILQEVRSRMALRYLSDERLGITEIAFLLGYADQGSFSSAFKSWHGVSPREYRRK